MTDELIRNATKFNGSNFQTWKFQMNNIFIANGLFELVNGTNMKPPGENDANEVKQWIRDNAKAMSIISIAIEHQQLENLLTCKTAAEMWTKLSNIHEQKSVTNKLLLLQKFHEYRMEANDSVVQYISKVQNMAAQLTDLGETISDTVVMAKILGSLPSKFSTLVTAWDSVAADQQTISILQERLIKEETKLNITDESVNAFAVLNLNRNQKPNSYFKPTKDKRTVSIECFYCKKRGHYARECRKKIKDMKSKNQTSNNDSSGKCAFVVTVNMRNQDVQDLLSQEMDDVWLTDSGASRHISFRRDWFSEFHPSKGDKVSLGDDEECDVLGTGDISISRLVNGVWYEGTIENVLYVPKIRKNLFSVGACTAKNFKVCFDGKFVVIERQGNIFAQGVKQENDVYRMCFSVKTGQIISEANVSTANLRDWHERLGHVNKRTIQDMIKKGAVSDIELSDVNNFFCESCALGKSHKLPFKHNDNTNIDVNPGELIHTDVCGPFSVESIGHSRYFVTFKDDATNYRSVYFIKHKSDVLEKFEEFDKMISNKFGRSIKTLRSDNGLEYRNDAMNRYLVSKGMQNTAPYTPEQNGKAERDNRTIVESARTMIHAKSLPLSLWAEAVNTAVYILNRTTSSKNKMTTPYEEWTGKKPSLSHIRTFGCEGYIYVDKQFRKKLDPKSTKILLMGYQADSTNYRVYDPQRKTIMISRNVIFNENVQRRDEEISATIKVDSLFNDQSESDNDEKQPTSENNEVRACENQKQLEEGNGGISGSRQLRNRQQIRKPARYELNYAAFHPPVTFQEAMTSPEAEEWMKAIKEELHAHDKNKTWVTVPKCPDYDVIDSKWVFKIMKDDTGEVTRFKARLCARGCRQRSEDYNETFSPVVRYDTLRVLLAIVAQEDLELVQFDVKTAFLHGELTENIYMEIPEGSPNTLDKNKLVCKLLKSMYGLKQASYIWNEKFNNFLENFSFKSGEADKCIYQTTIKENRVYLALYVDDGLLASSSLDSINIILDCLKQTFEITIGDASIFVGLQIERNRDLRSLFIHQTAYATQLIKKYNMDDAKGISVPAEPKTVLDVIISDEELLTNVPYRQVVGSLMFLAIASRPDIVFAVNAVSRFLEKHNKNHWNAVKRIIRYLINTADYGIGYKNDGSKAKLIGFADADFAGDPESRRSTTGYIFMLANGPVTWSSQKQNHVTWSTTESEYVAAATAAREAVWLRKLLKDLNRELNEGTVIYVDNQSAICLSKNPVYHKRSKHIDVKYHYLREKVKENEIVLMYIPTDCQLADSLTKALSRDKFYKFLYELGISKKMCAA